MNMRHKIVLALLLSLGACPRLCAADEDDPVAAGRKASEWLEMLRSDPAPKRRQAALIALEIVGPKARKVLPGIANAVRKDAEESVRAAAAQTLGRMAQKTR